MSLPHALLKTWLQERGAIGGTERFSDVNSAGNATADSPEPATSRGKRKSGEELAYEVLLHFTATVHGFYVAIAKAIHTPVRRRDDTVPQPTFAMRAAALNLAVVLRANLQPPRSGYDEAIQVYLLAAWWLKRNHPAE